MQTDANPVYSWPLVTRASNVRQIEADVARSGGIGEMHDSRKACPERSRRNAKHAKIRRNYEFEARNPKYETNPNDGNINDQTERH